MEISQSRERKCGVRGGPYKGEREVLIKGIEKQDGKRNWTILWRETEVMQE